MSYSWDSISSHFVEPRLHEHAHAYRHDRGRNYDSEPCATHRHRRLHWTMIVPVIRGWMEHVK